MELICTARKRVRWIAFTKVSAGGCSKAGRNGVAVERELMGQEAYVLDRERRTTVLAALRQVASYRNWNLLAAHVRSNHVHVVVEADVRPERVMNDFKSYASRRLNSLAIDAPKRKRWARHGSTRWLWKDDDVHEAVRYVVEEQGEAMAVFKAALL